MTDKNFVDLPAPIEELAVIEDFTNRKQELEFFWDLAEQATQRSAASYVILARKGMGKTALMLELYRQLFTRQKKVVPFFVSFSEDEEQPGRTQLTLERFISKLFLTFAFQYGAFKSGKYSVPPKLPRVLAEQKEFFASCGDAYLEKQFLGHLDALETGDIENAFDQAIEFASGVTSLRREAGIVMIDEFQVLTSIYDERYGKLRNITQWFQKPAESRWCPMVVSGSAVSLILETVSTGLLARRFGPYYLDPFAQPHSMEYAYKLGARKKANLTEGAAAQIHLLTGGNPYYIWCLFNSVGFKDKDLSTTEKIEALYTFETTDRNGKIRRFWDGHFKVFADKINGDKIGLQCLYQLAVAKQEIRIDEIAAQLNVQPEQVRRVLKNLEEADLIARQTGAYYHNITDPILAAYIEREYQTDIMGQPLASFLHSGNWRKRLGSAARLLGEAAELYTRHLLTSFAGQEIETADIFNLAAGNLKLPRFKKVEHRTGLVIAGEAVEFDLLAEGEETWLVEVKYRRTPVRLNDVEKFSEKLSKMDGWSIPLSVGKRIWFFSRCGFDAPASARLRELAILHSDLAGFNALCRAVGIGEVPVIK